MPAVIIKKGTYDESQLKSLVFEMLDSLGRDFVKKHTRVLIKPNLLLPATVEQAILTHPLVVKTAAQWALDRQARVSIGDSPATGSMQKIRRVGGYDAALAGLPIEFNNFKSTKRIDIGQPFGRIDMAGAPLETDVVLNLAKLKTHSQMLLTLGVKNLFGCIVGLRKPEWHLRSGINRQLFARLLVQIHEAVAPAVTLIDGILALEGQGPGKSGTPRRLGVLVGSDNAHLADAAVCKLINLKSNRLPTLAAAEKLGLLPEGAGDVAIPKEIPMVTDFRFPELATAAFGPKRMRRFMRRHLLQRPVVDTLLCELCGQCRKYCPAKAIAQDTQMIHFNYDACIRCYCCIEICPHGALKAVETGPGKFLRCLTLK